LVIGIFGNQQIKINKLMTTPTYYWKVVNGTAKIVDASGNPVPPATENQVLQSVGWDFNKLTKFETPAATPPTIYAGGKPPDDPSNKYNTETGKLNPKYVEPGGSGGDTGGGTSGNEPPPAKMSKEQLIEWLKGKDEYNALPKEFQDNVIAYIDILGISDTETQQKILSALVNSKATADPYWAEVINATTDALNTAIGNEEADLTSKVRDMNLRIQRINDDLASDTGTLTVNEKAELERQKVSYENNKQVVLDNAASSGLSFSSKKFVSGIDPQGNTILSDRRTLAESMLENENQDFVQSTERSYQQKLKSLQTEAARGNVDAQNQLADYQRIHGENIQRIGRAGESTLGSLNLPPLEGYTALGGQTGSLQEDWRNDILTGASALAGLGNL
jgi:hypothetical protein